MRFYNATAFLFPRNYPARLFALCFGAVHIPLVTFLVVEAVRGQWHWTIFFALLLATAVGSGLAIVGLWGLLAPIDAATKALREMHHGRLTPAIPVGGRDMAGDLLEATAHAVRSTSEKLQALHDIATTDLLTGLRNRRGLIEKIDQDGATGTLALLDADHLKRVNDTLGHQEGDRALRQMAAHICRHLRPQDIAARWGGDEFAIFFPHMAEDQARQLILRMRNAMLRRPLLTVGGQPFCFSFGTTQVLECAPAEVEDAVARADAALYEDKRSVPA